MKILKLIVISIIIISGVTLSSVSIFKNRKELPNLSPLSPHKCMCKKNKEEKEIGPIDKELRFIPIMPIEECDIIIKEQEEFCSRPFKEDLLWHSQNKLRSNNVD